MYVILLSVTVANFTNSTVNILRTESINQFQYTAAVNLPSLDTFDKPIRYYYNVLIKKILLMGVVLVSKHIMIHCQRRVRELMLY